MIHGEKTLQFNKEPTAEIKIGNGVITLRDIKFTKRQIKHIKKYFGFEVRNF